MNRVIILNADHYRLFILKTTNFLLRKKRRTTREIEWNWVKIVTYRKFEIQICIISITSADEFKLDENWRKFVSQSTAKTSIIMDFCSCLFLFRIMAWLVCKMIIRHVFITYKRLISVTQLGSTFGAQWRIPKIVENYARSNPNTAYLNIG